MPALKRKYSLTADNDADSCVSSQNAVTTQKKRVRWDSDSENESTADLEISEDTKATEKTCLTAWCQYGRVGCAYYDPLKCVVYVFEDTQETSYFDLTKMLLEQVAPDVILTSSKSDDDFIDILREYTDSMGGVFQIRPQKDFTFSSGQERILSLSLLSDLPQDISAINVSSELDSNSVIPTNAYDFMKMRQDLTGDPTAKRWNASIRLSNFTSIDSSPFCIASIGALLDHLVRERAVNDLDNDGIGGLDIQNIEALALDQVMHINADALFSLQIFENESHASVHSDKTKEGLSLFGTLNNTQTSLGRSLLRTWFLRPSLSLSVLKSRHDAVSCFISSENTVPVNAMHSHLKGIKNVPRILGVMKTGRAKVTEWQGLVKFTFHSAMLRDALSELHHGNEVEVIRKLTEALDIASFRDVGNKINEIIDWEESINAGRVCVRMHIDEELDNRKHVYHGIDSVLCKVAEQIGLTIPHDYASSLNVVYFPQLGFLICIPMLGEWQAEAEIKVMDGWSFQFSSDSHVYFKSQEMHDMDTHIGDLHSSIVDREIEIIQELLDDILVCVEAMGHACAICAELDCLLAFADASKTYDYRRPIMVEDNIIDIVQSRHPLQEQVIDTFVANDARLAGGIGAGLSSDDSDGNAWNSILLCTGANACGKSVYLKQVALIQYMAQIGCFVPAESATLGIVDKIFTRISTRDSVSKVQSAFMIDLNQVSLALRNSTARSLILLDEFGKGTLSTDGAGLFCGVLKHLLHRGPNCPKVLVATHFHDVFREDLLDPDLVSISFRHMQVMFTSSDGSVLDSLVETDSTSSQLGPASSKRQDYQRKLGLDDRITYLYRVAAGLSLDSHAAKCAEIFGIPSRMVQRAQYVSHLISTHELGRLLDEEMTDEERLDLEDAEAVCRRFLAWNLNSETGSVRAKLAEVLGVVDDDC